MKGEYQVITVNLPVQHRVGITQNPSSFATAIQQGVDASTETERTIVHGNWELIRLYEEKVKKVIERVWEG